MDGNVIHQSTVLALDGKISFGDVVKKLVGIGVERYYADLIRKEKIFYDHEQNTIIERLPLAELPPVAGEFSQQSIVEAIRAAQQGKIRYPEFLNRATKAGVAAYCVFIDGKHVAYYGRKGECHIEPFPK